MYCLIGHCDVMLDSHQEVANKTEDYLWLKVCMNTVIHYLTQIYLIFRFFVQWIFGGICPPSSERKIDVHVGQVLNTWTGTQSFNWNKRSISMQKDFPFIHCVCFYDECYYSKTSVSWYTAVACNFCNSFFEDHGFSWVDIMISLCDLCSCDTCTNVNFLKLMIF